MIVSRKCCFLFLSVGAECRRKKVSRTRSLSKHYANSWRMQERRSGRKRKTERELKQTEDGEGEVRKPTPTVRYEARLSTDSSV